METEPFLIHYDGSKWTEVIGDKSQMPDGFTDMYAINKNHFWISSSDNVSEYKNGIWKKYFIGENYYVQSIEGIDNSIYLTTYPIGIDSLYLMQLKGNNFTVINRTNLFNAGKFSPNGLQFVNNKVYTFDYGVNSTTFTNEGININSWQNDLKQFPEGGGFWNSYTISSKDIWGVGYPSIIYQFNGEEWQHIFINNQNLEATYRGIWGDGKEIFIC